MTDFIECDKLAGERKYKEAIDCVSKLIDEMKKDPNHDKKRLNGLIKYRQELFEKKRAQQKEQ